MMGPITLNLVNPNTTVAMTGTMAAAARRAAGPETEIVARTSTQGPASIEGWYDGAMAVPGLLAEIARGEAEAADAHVIACFDDTGVEAARQIATAPVIGIGSAACHLATQLADRFVVVTAAPVSVPVLEANLRLSGLTARCAGVRAAGMGVLQIEDHGDDVADAIRQAADELPDVAIVLGCGGMADLAVDLSQALGRPVIDGIAAAVVMAEGLARLGHRTVKAGGYAPKSH